MGWLCQAGNTIGPVSDTGSASSRGELAIVLHTHMPYVEGFGTWPFGEEWLWEAIATSYLPLLDVLGSAPITLSLTPVLCDQLEAPGAIERCIEFLDEVRAESHRLDIEAFRGGRRGGGGRRTRALGRRVPGGGRAAPEAGHRRAPVGARRARELDVRGHPPGAAAARQPHMRRAPGRDRDRVAPPAVRGVGRGLLAAGVRARELARRGARGGRSRFHLRRADRSLRSRRCSRTYVRWRPTPDRCCGRSTAQTISLVWSERGYPAAGAYRNYHGLTPHDHRAWGNDGQVYDHAAALALAAPARSGLRRPRA